ncbi:MAG: flagellar hook-basal body complex protein FliE [Phycisphaerales bacterium]
MSDPLGLVGSSGNSPLQARPPQAGQRQNPGAPSFKDVLIQNLEEVNAAEQDASRAVEDLVSGKRDDLDGVILATEKADNAFRMLQAMRNKVMDAYEEIKQMRV